MYKGKSNRHSKALSKTIGIIIAVVIIIAAIAGIYLLTSSHKAVTAQAISLAPTTPIIQQGLPITFTVYDVVPNSQVVLYLGNGQTLNETAATSAVSFTYTYNQPGQYLVYAVEYLNGKPVQNTSTSLLTIQVNAVLNETESQLLSIPVIAFDTAKNPNAPIFTAGSPVYFYGGFLQPPSGQNMTIEKYMWELR